MTDPALAPLGSIYTIGYEGKTIDRVLSTLAANRIQVLVDVRRTPWSHKADFTRARLSAAAESHGVRYVHLPQLGSDPSLRKSLKVNGDWGEFARGYLDYLTSLNGGIESAFSPLAGQRLCLLCSEADPAMCHRTLLARKLVEAKLASLVVSL